MEDEKIIAWVVGNDAYCSNPHVLEKHTTELTLPQTLNAIIYGAIRNECKACGEALVTDIELAAAMVPQSIEGLVKAAAEQAQEPGPVYKNMLPSEIIRHLLKDPTTARRKPVAVSTLRPLSYCNLCDKQDVPLKMIAFSTGPNSNQALTICENCSVFVGVFMLRLFAGKEDTDK